MKRSGIKRDLVEVFNDRSKEPLDLALQTRTEKSVHNQSRLRDFTADPLPLFVSNDFLDLGSWLFEPGKILGGVSACRVLAGENIDLGLQTSCLKVPCDNKTIAAVIPLAAKDRRVACRYVAIGGSQELKESCSGVFHELQAGNAVPLGGEAVYFAHFGSGESFHRRFTTRSEHPATADIDDLSG